MISASSLDRATRCDGSVILPQTHHESPEANRGTLIHEWLRSAIYRPDDPPTPPEEVAAVCNGVDLRSLTCGGIVHRTEAKFAYDVYSEKVRELTSEVDRDYSECTPTEIPGTLDLLLLGPTGPHAVDYKTGNPVTIPARNNLQLRFAALVARSMFPYAPSIKVSFCYLDHQGRDSWDTAELDDTDLEDTRILLRAAFERWTAARERGNAPVVPGPHCRHCPSQRHCPEYAARWESLATLDGEGWVAGLARDINDDQFASAAWERVKRYSEVLEIVQEQLRARAIARPIPLGNGIVVAAKSNKNGTVVVKERKAST